MRDKTRLLLFAILLLFGQLLMAQRQSLSADQSGSTVDLSLAEFRGLVGKLAVLRRERYQLLRRHQLVAAQRKRVTESNRRRLNRYLNDTTIVIRPDGGRDTTIIVRPSDDYPVRKSARQAMGNDTTIIVRPGGNNDTTIIVRPPEGRPTPRSIRQVMGNDTTITVRPGGDNDTLITVFYPKRKRITPATTPDVPGMAELRQRLDRQETLLREINERLTPPKLASTTSSAPATAPAKKSSQRDTLVQRILLEQKADGLTPEDLRAISEEVNALNRELQLMRRQLAAEERSRFRTERQLNLLRRNVDLSPNTVIRDTVYVEKDRLEPVLIPSTTPAPPRDTIVIYRETVREVSPPPVVRRDTVIVKKTETREVVNRDTVRLEAREPLTFPAIFFGNNSATLTVAHRNLLATVSGQLPPEYTLQLTGFASPSGNAAYNRQLSARRAEAVRQGLVAAGLPAARIRVLSGGVDYSPAKAAAARRVEITAIAQ